MAKRDKKIKLHPEFGLNPTMPVCRWCDQPTGEIALLGNAYKGEAPMRMILDDQPCRACRGRMSEGITLIEVTHEGGGRTGRWCVITEKGVHRIFKPGTAETMLAARSAFISVETANIIGVFDGEMPDDV